MLSLAKLQSLHPHYFISQHNADGVANPDWLALRGLGSTSISKLLCLSGGVYEQTAVFNRLHGLPYEEADLSNVAAIQYGNAMEDVALDCFMKYYNKHSMFNGLRKVKLERPGLLQQLKKGWILNNKLEAVDILLTDSPDFMLVDALTDTCQYMGEIKCAYSRNRKFTAENLPYNYYLQIQWHMIVSGVQQCLFVDYKHEKHLNVLIVDYDSEFAEATLFLAQFQLGKSCFSKLDADSLKLYKKMLIASRKSRVRGFFDEDISGMK